MPAEIIIDMDMLQSFMQMKPTLKETALIFKCSEDTIERRIKADSGLTFQQFRDLHLTDIKRQLVSLAIRKALDEERPNDDMHKFCLKNLAQWSEKVEQLGDKAPTVFTLNYSLEESKQKTEGQDEGQENG